MHKHFALLGGKVLCEPGFQSLLSVATKEVSPTVRLTLSLERQGPVSVMESDSI